MRSKRILVALLAVAPLAIAGCSSGASSEPAKPPTQEQLDPGAKLGPPPTTPPAAAKDVDGPITGPETAGPGREIVGEDVGK